MSRILITGANGFIGHALCRNALQSGHEVVSIKRDNAPSPHGAFQPTYTVHGDITDPNVTRRAIADYEVEIVHHLAAQSIVRVCANDPVSAYQTNVMGTVNLLEACRTVGKNHVKSVVISTSDKAFGHAPVPYTEDTPLQPKFTYETTKACQDFVAQNYFHNYEVPVMVTRCSNVYGPGDLNWSRLIPNTIRRILNNQPPVIYADVAEFVREFVYIDDVVAAFNTIAALGTVGEVYCVGDVVPINIEALVRRILDLCNSELEIETPVRPVNFKEIKEQYIRGDKIKALGWQPQVDLQEGLRRTIEFCRSHQ